ncbi:hypothetical protein [Nocardioides marmoribigeumensis]|jgi:hypothetical protein|uniref:Uncharacterized protein n=1 Tax=Nocardioides marmoribigeumensis TaxID=433649 RepID=A0ABU2BQL2_9ACTN|nr:hypothetical protein [Nocardioides marmoribigeumensis]MDR7360923.1 hypothetical protein [Nocardioides marmoribigeumensis]
MEWILLLALGAGAAGAGRRLVVRRGARRDARAELAGVRHLAEEDVVVFGEELQRLDEVVGDHPLDADARRDYQTALDAYESAQRAVERLEEVAQVSRVADVLTTGRYALACVRARVEGTPMPAMRTPCFFNPQHGPAATEVLWTTGRLGTKRVPACSQCSARVANRETPEVRTVYDGSTTVPYWEAGAAYEPYRSGYVVADLARAMRAGYGGGGGAF